MNCNVLINKTILIYVISVLNFLSLQPTSHKKDNLACVILSRQHVSQTVEKFFLKLRRLCQNRSFWNSKLVSTT